MLNPLGCDYEPPSAPYKPPFAEFFTRYAEISPQSAEALRALLSFAVPVWRERWAAQIAALGHTKNARCRAQELATCLGEHGSFVELKTDTKRGKVGTAQAFNELAEGLAIASLVSSHGVEFLGLKWGEHS